MDIDAAFLIALGGVITAMVAMFPALSALNQSRATARRMDVETRLTAHKDEVELLRAEVARLSCRVDDLSTANAKLQVENLSLQRKVLVLEMENTWLRRELRSHGIEIPPLPNEIRGLQQGAGELSGLPD